MSSRRLTAIVLVVLLHALLGYALVTGLAASVLEQVKDDLSTFDVIEEPPPPPPPEDPPPPPPEQPQTVQPPPLVTPPPIVQTPAPAPQMQAVTIAPPNPPPVTYTAPVAPAPPAPPAAPAISKAAGIKGNPGTWIRPGDYPASAKRDNLEGKVRVTFEVSAQGKIENCRVTGGDNISALDNATCPLITRRGSYTPAQDAAGNRIPGGTKSLTFTWRLEDS